MMSVDAQVWPRPCHRPRLQLVFSLDYEIHGNGEGDPGELMVARTERLLDILEEFGAKLTIMADTVEILKFREYRDASGRDEYAYEAIEGQLKRAVARGHDVQLHLHPAYARAHVEGGKWVLDYGEYDLAQLGYDRIFALVKDGKDYLEGILQPVRPDYSCIAFRAANWSMSPSATIVRALVANGIRIDTSVFKYGSRAGLVRFDYSKAESEAEPWPVDASDVCRRDDGGQLFEFPIYCERLPIWSFLSLNRVNNAIQNRIHPLPPLPPAPTTRAESGQNTATGATPTQRRGTRLAQLIFEEHARKLDFNQCSGRQMAAALRRAEARFAQRTNDVPIVLIGHSKLFHRQNEGHLRTFLDYVASRPDCYGFSTFGAFDLDAVRARVPSGSGSVERPAVALSTVDGRGGA
jgi:peptidoglycan/xylan/chitin deacetylase (PgdA/CDA1 family)